MDELNENIPVQPVVEGDKYVDDINLLKNKIQEIEDVKKSLAELESLKGIHDEVERLKGLVSKLENDYEPISGAARTNSEPQRFGTIHDFYNYHFTK